MSTWIIWGSESQRLYSVQIGWGFNSRVQAREEERGPWTYDCYASNRVSPTKTHGGLVSKATVLEIVGLSGKINAFFLGSSS
jgi:hypothetical protein